MVRPRGNAAALSFRVHRQAERVAEQGRSREQVGREIGFGDRLSFGMSPMRPLHAKPKRQQAGHDRSSPKTRHPAVTGNNR